MFQIKPSSAVLLPLLLICSWVRLVAADSPPRQDQSPARRPLTGKNLHDLHPPLRPHDNQGRHLRVDWLTDVVAARKEAAAEDKPIVICHTGGAGYNEPL